MAKRQPDIGDAAFENPSQDRQWQERASRPIASRYMSEEDIEYFRQVLEKSYACQPGEIKFGFRGITNANDPNFGTCLTVYYTIPHVDKGKSVQRIIYSIPMPIPDDVKSRAEKIRRERMRTEGQQALPAPAAADPSTQLVVRGAGVQDGNRLTEPIPYGATVMDNNPLPISADMGPLTTLDMTSIAGASTAPKLRRPTKPVR